MGKVLIKFTFPNSSSVIEYDWHQKNFHNGEITKEEILKHLKGLYGNKDRFEERFLQIKFYDKTEEHLRIMWLSDLEDYFRDNFEAAEPYSYKEAFEIKNATFRAIVFESINIVNMIEELGHELIKTEGQPMVRKTWDKQGNFTGTVEYTNVYETHKVYGKKLDLRNDIYAVKCWCTSTSEEHWIWIDEKYKDSPLEAIASTFRIHENVIPHIKELKRQGDVMLVEMKEQVDPSGNIRPLTPKEYFGLLTSES